MTDTGIKLQDVKTRKKKMTRTVLMENIAGYAFLIPWFIGIFVFTAFPMIWSMQISLTDRSLLRAVTTFVGFDNYRRLFSDATFWHSLRVTMTYAFWQVPISMFLSLLAALAMNRKIRGIGIFRTILYLPVIVGGSVGSFVMWRMLLADAGFVNYALSLIGLGPFRFFNSVDLALGTLIGMSMWTIGGRMLILLAGLQQVPEDLYESATIDGAGSFRKLISITLPMISPVILFSLIMGIIGALQVFEAAFVITGGGPARATYFFVLYLYEEAFVFGRFGTASALAWVLFVIIMFFTMIVLKTSKRFVFYQAGPERGKE